jgi:hypothetical protein
MFSYIRCVWFQCGGGRMDRVKGPGDGYEIPSPRHDEQGRPVVGNTSGTQRMLLTTTTGGNLDEGRRTNLIETLADNIGHDEGSRHDPSSEMARHVER